VVFLVIYRPKQQDAHVQTTDTQDDGLWEERELIQTEKTPPGINVETKRAVQKYERAKITQ
jgi:hypothetical protein